MTLRIWLVIAGLLLAPSAAWSQGGGAAAEEAPVNVDFDPIRCWWRTSAGAVRTGETFSLVLTCAVLDNEGAQVQVDESKLAPSVMQLVPFEVVGGSRPADLRERQRRFFQYDYVLRAISPDLIGRDVPLPALILGYRVNSRIPGNAAQQGRELSYLLPPQSIRVVSMVPADADDIRDTPDAGFAGIESLRSRAGVMDVVAVTLAGLGSVMVLLAAVGLFTGTRKRERAGPRALAPYTLAGLAARELSSVSRDAAAQGWDDARLERALAATRLAAACATGRTVSQRPVADNGIAPAGEGRLLYRRLRPQGGRVAVSASTTTDDLTRAIDTLPPAASPSKRVSLERLRDAMAAFTAARYARAATVDRSALDAAVEAAATAAQQVRTEHLRPAALVRAWRRRAPEGRKAA